MRLTHMVCIAGLTIAATACGQSPRSVESTDTISSADSRPLAGDRTQDALGTTLPGVADSATNADQADREGVDGTRELPSTASSLALAGLVGLLAFGGAAALRALRW